MDRDTAEALVAKAHEICPYSNATRGNISVDIKVLEYAPMNATLPAASREIRLASRPVGRPTAANFRLAESPLPALGDGQVMVKNPSFLLIPTCAAA